MTNLVHSSDGGVTIKAEKLDMMRMVITVSRQSTNTVTRVILTKDRAVHFLRDFLSAWIDIDG